MIGAYKEETRIIHRETRGPETGETRGRQWVEKVETEGDKEKTRERQRETWGRQRVHIRESDLERDY